MTVRIVFESMFGHTAELADAVAFGLRSAGADVLVQRAEDPREPGGHALAGVDLLVLAAPTHALSLSRPASRADAVERGADPVAASTGLREWMASLPLVSGPAPVVAVFDTRARSARHWPGSAARAAGRVMRSKGYVVRDRTSFYVEDVTGPLLAGELERAGDWGRDLRVTVPHRPVGPEA